MADPFAESESVLEAARQALSAHERTAALAARIPLASDGSPPRVALVGPYSAGKSLLIAALLRMSDADAERISAATPKTTTITTYGWRSYELLDLPGTLSGVESHDQVARQGVRSCDALLIVTTVELPGNEETAAIRKLLDVDGFRGRCTVVVNKSGSENSSPEIIRGELQRRIGGSERVPIVFTDARDFLDSVNEPSLTPEDRHLLYTDSGIADLENAVEAIFSQGVPPRRVAQLHEAARVLDDGLALWEPTVEEEIIDATANRAQAALDRARGDATDDVERALTTLGHGIRAIGTHLSTSVDATTGRVPDADVKAAAAQEQEILHDYVASVNRGLGDVLTRLASDLQAALRQQQEYSSTLPGRTTKVPTDNLAPGMQDQLLEALYKRLSKEGSQRLKSLIQEGTRPGSTMHGYAQRLNRLIGKDPKPYAHVHTAESLSKGLNAANFALEIATPVVDIGSVINDAMRNRHINQRREDVVAAYAKRAEALMTAERDRTRAHVDVQLQPYVEGVTPQLEDAAAWRAARDTASGQLTSARTAIVEAAAGLD